MYIADESNHRIRKVTVLTSIITTIAGTGGTSYSGDNGLATSATLDHPYGVTVDSSGIITISTICCTVLKYLAYLIVIFVLLKYIDIPLSNIGNVYIGDTYNHRARKVTLSTGIITTIAGTGTGSYSGDNGPATSATLYYPYGVALDVSGIITITNFCAAKISFYIIFLMFTYLCAHFKYI